MICSDRLATDSGPDPSGAPCEVLGPLPETRWVEPRAGDTVPASV